MFDTNYELRNLNLKLSVENEQLRSGANSSHNGSGAAAAAKISQLEKKLLTQQEELTELHKRKGENSQMIVDLSLKLDKQNKVLTEKDATSVLSSLINSVPCQLMQTIFHLLLFFHSISEHRTITASLRAEVVMLTTSMQELKSLNTCLRDEHTALQLAFASLEEKLRKVQVNVLVHRTFTAHFHSFTHVLFQDENRQLVERLIKYKAKDAEKLNEENESFLK